MSSRRSSGILVAGLLVGSVAWGGCVTHPKHRRSAAPGASAPTAAAPMAAPVVVRRGPSVATVVRPAPAAPRTVTPKTDVPAANAPGRQRSSAYGSPGFAVFEDDGRLWVFREGSDALAGFQAKGEPAKRITRIGVGPEDKTVMSDERATIDAYLVATRYAVPGFNVEIKDGRLWVFEQGSSAYAEFKKVGEPAKRVTRIGQGPHDLTVIGPDGETLDGYIATARYGRPGFATYLIDGRIWVFRRGSEALEQFETVGEPAKRITRVGVGPDEKSVIGPDAETLDAYLAAWR